jgi:phosphonate transport system substrate-binding protein
MRSWEYKNRTLQYLSQLLKVIFVILLITSSSWRAIHLNLLIYDMINSVFYGLVLMFCPFFLIAQSSLSNKQTLVIATYQYGDNPRIQNIEPFANHFGAAAEINAIVKSYPTVHQLLQAMNKGEVDVAFMNTFGYLLLREQTTTYEISAALHLPEAEAVAYRSVIVANKQTRIRTLENGVKNAGDNLLVLVSPGSTSGNLLPRLKLASMMEVEPETVFVEVQYRERHHLALQVALSGEFALAAFGSEEYYKLGADTIKLYKLWESPPIPLGPVVCKKSLSENLKNMLQQTLLDLHLQNETALESVKAGWTEAKPADKFMVTDDTPYDRLINLTGNRERALKIIRRFAR